LSFLTSFTIAAKITMKIYTKTYCISSKNVLNICEIPSGCV
jgi:hypothetical protein